MQQEGDDPAPPLKNRDRTAEFSRVTRFGRYRAAACAATVLLLVAPLPAEAGPSLDERLAEARARANVARADFATLLAVYRSASLDADEAVARSLALRQRAEQLRAAFEGSRKSFRDTVARVYIDGPGALVEAVLGSRDLADLNALMPFAESNLAVRIDDARALSRQRARLERLFEEVERGQRAAVAEEQRLSLVARAIAHRLTQADAAVLAARAAVDRAEARRRRDLLQGAWTSTKRTVDMALYRRRKARGEQMFREAAPFLGPRPDCSAPRGLRAAGMTLAGKASWYGAEFAGKGTASGAVYDPWRYTVAHRTLPFGLFLLIKSDGKCVVSLLNDRGPYIYDRILDLSAASAKAVDLSGVEHVDAIVFVRDTA